MKENANSRRNMQVVGDMNVTCHACLGTYDKLPRPDLEVLSFLLLEY